MWLREYTNLNDESGVTLIELLAAITILSIIVTAFLSFFIQGARTNMRADDMNQATFIAQEEMEIVIFHSYENSLGELINSIDQLETHSPSLDGENVIIRSTNEGYDVVTSIKQAGIENLPSLYSVVVEVRQAGRIQAKMENRLVLENED